MYAATRSEMEAGAQEHSKGLVIREGEAVPRYAAILQRRVQTKAIDNGDVRVLCECRDLTDPAPS